MAWNNPPPPGYVIEGTQPPATFAIGLAAFIPFLPSALAGIQAMLYGAFGLGPLQFDAKAQLQAALGVSLAWNPTAALQANAQVGLALSGFVPSLQVNAALSANLQLKIGGIQLLMNLGVGLLLQIPPLLAAINGFFNLPACYFAIYNGPPGGMKQLAACVPGPSAAAMMIAAGYPNQLAGAAFVTALTGPNQSGGLFTGKP